MPQPIYGTQKEMKLEHIIPDIITQVMTKQTCPTYYIDARKTESP